MSWRKAGGQHQFVPPPAATDGLEDAFSKLSIEEEEDNSNIRRIQTKKFLSLNLVTYLLDKGFIGDSAAAMLRQQCLSTTDVDADALLSYTPEFYSNIDMVKPPRPPASQATLQSCVLLIEKLGKAMELPWRTVQTAVILLERYCFVKGSSEVELVNRVASYVFTLQYPDRIVVSCACLLLASKVEETLCRLTSMLAALRDVIGNGAYMMSVPTPRVSHQQGMTRQAHYQQPQDPDTAMATAIRHQECAILEGLGFDIEFHQPQNILKMLNFIDYAFLNPETKSLVLNKAFHILDEVVLSMDNTLSILYPVPIICLCTTYLSWYIIAGKSLKDECSEDERFRWHILSRLDEDRKVIVKGICGFIVEAINSEDCNGWERFLFAGAENIPAKSGLRTYQKGTCSSAMKYKKIENICEGTYGSVWVARNRQSKAVVAMKQLKNTMGRDGFPYYMLREVLFLRRLNHPNVVSGKEVLVDKNDGEYEFYIVMEYISFDMRDLWSAQLDRSATPLWREGDVKDLIKQLLQAIAYMHRQGLMHRDIKLENLLFDKGVLKVADLGSIRESGRSELKLTTAVVTLWYRPPELLLGNTTYTNSIDIWSIGCVIVELLVMKALFPGKDVNDMMLRIASVLGKPDRQVWEKHFARLPKANKLVSALERRLPNRPFSEILKAYSPSCRDLVEKMVCYDPESRITAEEALKHPYFSEEPLPQLYSPTIRD